MLPTRTNQVINSLRFFGFNPQTHRFVVGFDGMIKNVSRRPSMPLNYTQYYPHESRLCAVDLIAAKYAVLNYVALRVGRSEFPFKEQAGVIFCCSDGMNMLIPAFVDLHCSKFVTPFDVPQVTDTFVLYGQTISIKELLHGTN